MVESSHHLSFAVLHLGHEGVACRLQWHANDSHSLHRLHKQKVHFDKVAQIFAQTDLISSLFEFHFSNCRVPFTSNMLSSKLLPLACLSHATRKSARHFQDISLQEAIIRAWAMQRLHKASSKILDLSVVAFRLWHENQPLTWGNLGGDGFTGFTFGSRSLTGGCCNIHSVDSAHLLTAQKKTCPFTDTVATPPARWGTVTPCQWQCWDPDN